MKIELVDGKKLVIYHMVDTKIFQEIFSVSYIYLLQVCNSCDSLKVLKISHNNR